MASNQVCSFCSQSADYFCVCLNFPRLCLSHKSTHVTKPGFHFASPIANSEFADKQRPQYRTWGINLVGCQGKLRADLQLLDQCRSDTEAAFSCLLAELQRSRTKFLEAIDELKISLQKKIEEAILESDTSPFHHTQTHLADLMYKHCYNGNLESLTAFRYHVSVREECLKDCLSISFSSSVPELSALNREETEGYLTKQIAELHARCEQLQSILQGSHSSSAFSFPSSQFGMQSSRGAPGINPQADIRNYAGFAPQPPLASHSSVSRDDYSRPSAGQLPQQLQEISPALYGPGDGKPIAPAFGSHPAIRPNMPQPQARIDEIRPSLTGPGDGRPPAAQMQGLALELPNVPRPANCGPGNGRPEAQIQVPPTQRRIGHSSTQPSMKPPLP